MTLNHFAMYLLQEHFADMKPSTKTVSITAQDWTNLADYMNSFVRTEPNKPDAAQVAMRALKMLETETDDPKLYL